MAKGRKPTRAELEEQLRANLTLLEAVDERLRVLWGECHLAHVVTGWNPSLANWEVLCNQVKVLANSMTALESLVVKGMDQGKKLPPR